MSEAGFGDLQKEPVVL